MLNMSPYIKDNCPVLWINEFYGYWWNITMRIQQLHVIRIHDIHVLVFMNKQTKKVGWPRHQPVLLTLWLDLKICLGSILCTLHEPHLGQMHMRCKNGGALNAGPMEPMLRQVKGPNYGIKV